MDGGVGQFHVNLPFGNTSGQWRTQNFPKRGLKIFENRKVAARSAAAEFLAIFR